MPTGIGVGIAGQVFENKVGSSTPPPSFENLYSVKFNGIDQSLRLLNTAPLLGTGGTGDFSISFWIKPVSLTSGNQRLWAFGAGGTLQTQMFITTTGNIQFGGPWSDGFSSPDNGLVAGQWAHIVYRVNRASSTLNVGYVTNGVNINNKNQSISTTFDDTGHTYFGRNVGSFGFRGHIDEFSIYNKYLSNAEVTEIYNSGTPNDLSALSTSANLQHWWRMGDPLGQPSYPTIADTVGSLDVNMVNQSDTDITTDVP
jgi:hypothetical protein